MLGGIDAYFTAKFHPRKKELRTKTVVQKNEKCVMDQVFKMPVQWPPTTDRLVIKVMDEDKVTDETVGSIHLSIRDIVRNFSNPGG